MQQRQEKSVMQVQGCSFASIMRFGQSCRRRRR